jgi:hypothetical protein
MSPPVGAVVTMMIQGLLLAVSKPELNGQECGTGATQLLRNGRCAVKLWDTEEQVAIKPDNLTCSWCLVKCLYPTES